MIKSIFFLGITNKTSEKINEKNLLNFYLSSVTIKNFKYQPTKKQERDLEISKCCKI